MWHAKLYSGIHFIHTALHPDPVQNLSAVVDANIPTVTLSWDPPINVQSADELTCYLIQVRNNKNIICGHLKCSTTRQVLTRDSGLVLFMKYSFQVTAQSATHQGEYREVSAMYSTS